MVQNPSEDHLLGITRGSNRLRGRCELLSRPRRPPLHPRSELKVYEPSWVVQGHFTWTAVGPCEKVEFWLATYRRVSALPRRRR